MDPLVEIQNLKAYYRAFLFGVDREVRAVDDISLTIARGEVYGVAGESSSGKTTLIKTIAGAIRPPLRVVSGSVKFHFAGGTQDIYAMSPEERMLSSGERQCNGSYADQINPGNALRARCALTGKGIRYWEYIPKVFALDPAVDHTPCPFKADSYQWMRNAVLAAAFGKHHKLQAAALAAFADHPSFPTARKAKRGLLDASLGGHAAITPISYQQITAIACHGLGCKTRITFLALFKEAIVAGPREIEAIQRIVEVLDPVRQPQDFV